MPAPEPAPRILVTAFEPFGPPGKPLRPENASERVLRAFLELHPARVSTVVLPVDARCEIHLAREFDRDPAGVVATGEAGGDGPWDTNVEEVARDLPVAASATLDPGAAGNAVFRTSLFAPALSLLPGMEREDRIGSYWCNRAYWRVLEWTQLFHRPAVFLHFRVGGDRERQVAHLAHVVAAMERTLHRAPPPRVRRGGGGTSLASSLSRW